MAGLTSIERLVRLIMNQMYTCIPAEVIEINANRFVKVKLLVGDDITTRTPVINVPVLRYLGGSVPLKTGMQIPIWFCKNAIGEYIRTLSAVTSKGPLEELQFDRNNAFALPFLFDDKLNIKFPDVVEFDTKVIFKEPIECKKTALIKGVVTAQNNVDVGKDINIKGKLSAFNYNKHTHTEQGDGAPTSGPSE